MLAHKTQNYKFLGAFAKLFKATIIFFMSVCASVRMEQLGFQWTDFHEFYFGEIGIAIGYRLDGPGIESRWG